MWRYYKTSHIDPYKPINVNSKTIYAYDINTRKFVAKYESAIEAGLAISEMIAGMKKPTVSLVLGGGHSIGVPLAVAADCSFIVPSATMTLHPVRVNGLVLGVPQAFTHFQRMQDRIVDFVCTHSRMSADRFRQLCMCTDELVTDVGSVLNGEDAVAEGLIDQLGSLHAAMDTLYEMIEKENTHP